MKIELSPNEIGIIKIALHYACRWEASLIEAYSNVDQKDSPEKQCRKNIKNFEKLYKKLKNKY